MPDLGVTAVLGVITVFLWMIYFVARAMVSTFRKSELRKWREDRLQRWGLPYLAELEGSERLQRFVTNLTLIIASIFTAFFSARVIEHAIERAQ
ncbi:MAG: hypothetical protein AAFO57_08600 [Pseudomonadota bacterium]